MWIQFYWFQFFWVIGQISFACDRSPVPIPGMASSRSLHSTSATTQKRLYECPGFQHIGHQGEGYCGSISTVGADNWITEFCQGSAKNGKQPPMSSQLKSSHCTIYSSTEEELQKGLPQSAFEWVLPLSWKPHAASRTSHRPWFRSFNQNSNH